MKYCPKCHEPQVDRGKCAVCGELTAWKRPANPREIGGKQIYVCYECVESFLIARRVA
jgi:hypothetical protein